MLGVCTDHLFLCPRNALGRPVRIRTVPRTPKAGSIFVAKTLGEDVGVDDAEAVALDLVVGVGTAIVRVTLTTVGRTLTIARVWEPVLAREVVVRDDV